MGEDTRDSEIAQYFWLVGGRVVFVHASGYRLQLLFAAHYTMLVEEVVAHTYTYIWYGKIYSMHTYDLN